ncbi:facilitated trehalose transporter Tret1 isoform X1 [Neodiprion lecontei]|uniref:Facilitated trehalose transporter Tret1 isoform X1 n=2 Tax=Neodiprion lecontei TaxID=441921 RepID=A0A6J0B6A9_NEOLC|nr:facilitated trehalose transporter Tret1 isoform X1 [Neodiprion lecontei]XP_046595324.1 facilitated trehalose transporter Tret1 isoform X1 [Neodiprion lecontei]XP_046595325.1 facilitated trehalose transporter Tret1 isoform X1 [Neodiprion lecontei]
MPRVVVDAPGGDVTCEEGDVVRARRHTSMMTEKIITVSELTLSVSSGDDSKPAVPAKQLPQYFAALSATLGALAFGGVLGWSTSGGDSGEKLAEQYNITMSTSDFSWIGSVTNLGSAAICIPMGLMMDAFGRKRSMLILVVPYTIGWSLVIWAKSVAMFCVGRFLLGFSGGGFCVAVAVYTAEIGEKTIRGRLGAFHELMLTSGILISYILGTLIPIYYLSMTFAAVPLIFFVVFSFMPESPTYYLMKNREEEARDSLLRVRGPKYDVERELITRKLVLAEELQYKGSFLAAMRSKVARNGLIIAYGLMFFQQMSGVNAIVFYTGSIFGQNGAISTDASTIIVGALQVVSTFTSLLIVDRLGRKILLLASISAMAVGMLALGTYYYLEENGVDVSSVNWIPLVSVCLFILMSSLGFGPIPFMMVGELFSPQIKGIAGSSACSFNWLMAFLVTRTFNDLVEAFGNYATFWMYSVICACGVLFVIFIVPETKGKSLEQIQRELGAKITVPIDVKP